jgi:hypothetical protein
MLSALARREPALSHRCSQVQTSPHEGRRLQRVGAVLLTLALASCTKTVLTRLDGDPAQAAPLTTPYTAIDASADGVRRYVEAVRKGQWELAWAALSASTRAALTARARIIGAEGMDLLRPLPTGADIGLQRVHIGDPLAAFALSDARTYSTPQSPWPVEQTYDGRRLEATVVIEGAQDHRREVLVAFEGAGWRIHNPTLTGARAIEATP